MKQGIFTIAEHTALTEQVCKMRLVGDVSDITAPGQFINIKLDGLFLRRPISVYDRDDTSVTIIYKVVGKGTEQLQQMQVGQTLDVLTGLGNGYDISRCTDHAVLLGGGVGVPPLYLLAKTLLAAGKRVSVVLGRSLPADSGRPRDRPLPRRLDASRSSHSGGRRTAYNAFRTGFIQGRRKYIPRKFDCTDCASLAVFRRIDCHLTFKKGRQIRP